MGEDEWYHKALTFSMLYIFKIQKDLPKSKVSNCVFTFTLNFYIYKLDLCFKASPKLGGLGLAIEVEISSLL